MLDLNDKYLSKLEKQGVKVVNGDQTSIPILKWFNDTTNKEVVLVTNSEDYEEDVVRMFGVFDLRLLHPSNIHF